MLCYSLNILSILSLFLLSFKRINCFEIFIDSNSNGGSGTESNPFSSLSDINMNEIQTIITTNKEDVYIYLKRGSFFTLSQPFSIEASGTASNYITITNYGDEKNDLPTISGNKQSIDLFYFENVQRNVQYMNIDGIKFIDAYLGIRVRHASYINIKNCFFDNMIYCEGSNFGTRGMFILYSSFVTIDNCEVKDCGSDTGSADIQLSYCDNIVVRNSKLYGNGVDTGIDGIGTIDSYNLLFENNEIHDHMAPLGEGLCPGAPGGGEDGIDLKRGTHDVIIRNNAIYGHRYQSGITIQMNSNNVLIYNNMIYDNKWGGVNMMDGVELKGDGNSVQNVDIYNNLILSNWQSAVSISQEPDGDREKDITVRYNVLYNNAHTPSHLEWKKEQCSGVSVRSCVAGFGHIISNNLFINNNQNQPDKFQMDVEFQDCTSSTIINDNFFFQEGELYSIISYDNSMVNADTIGSRNIMGIQNQNILISNYRLNNKFPEECDI